MVQRNKMRRNKTITIKEALEDLIREYNLEPKLREASVINIWESIMGKAIVSRTKKIYIKQGVLHIYLTSSVVRNELMMLRESLRTQINTRAGEEVVKEIAIH
jgi:predicted nucleic acid-binding Zn ribbon protein